MAGEDNRIAERLREVENGVDDEQARGTSVEDADVGETEITISPGADAESDSIDEESALEDAVEAVSPESDAPEEMDTEEWMNDDMSIAEQLGTAADFRKRAAQLRQEAITTTERQLAQVFEQEVEVVLDPQDDGTLTGEIRIPELESELGAALDEETKVAVEHISVVVGNGSTEE